MSGLISRFGVWGFIVPPRGHPPAEEVLEWLESLPGAEWDADEDGFFIYVGDLIEERREVPPGSFVGWGGEFVVVEKP